MSAEATQQEQHEQHPIKIFLQVWVLLFVLSTFSYLVDYINVQGFWRWTLVLVFMVLKAGFIMAIFMHVMWERVALVLTIVTPPIALLFLIFFMAFEGEYINSNRVEYLGQQPDQEPVPMEEIRAAHH